MTEMRKAILGLAGAMNAADDQAQAMTDAELGALLTSGRWTTIEVHEAGRRLLASATSAERSPISDSSRPVSTDEEEGQELEDGGLQSRPSGGGSNG